MTEAQTSQITVVGGVYEERCMRPQWREVFGSAGRAASAIASMGVAVNLHSYFDRVTRDVVESRSALQGVNVYPTPIKKAIEFDYHHGLETPRIYGLQEQSAPLHVTADNVVLFGMLEGDAVVHGDRVVYDPQNAREPKPFSANGSTARQLAVVLNRNEAGLLSGMPDAPVQDMADALLLQHAAQVVIIKQGPLGALVHDGVSAHMVSAYQSERVWKIGSGDNFVAHFAYRWLHEGRSAAESADMASKATAYYCQTKGFATPRSFSAFSPAPITPSARYAAGHKPIVYLAGPFFTLAQLWMVEQARADLGAMGLKVFSPYHDVGHGSADDVVLKDLDGIDKADMVFAIGDGLDSGTIYEIGYARAKNKPVVMYCENESAENKKMMQGSGCTLCADYVSSVYQTLWTAASL